MTRRALCLGINDYPGTSSDLAGCVNDAHDWAEVLTSRGYLVAMLLDSDATRRNIVAGIRQTLAATEPGETAVITFSGHGTWQPDGAGDEPDGRTEALCPHDAASGALLTDDALHRLFGERPAGSHVVMVSDSCHSGTVTRAARPLVGDGVGRARYLAPEVTMGPPSPGSVKAKQRAELVEPGRGGAPPHPRCQRQHEALLLSGCLDSQFAYDAAFGGRANGAFTYAALTALAELPVSATYADWHAAIGEQLPSPFYPQDPQLQGSAEMRAARVLA